MLVRAPVVVCVARVSHREGLMEAAGHNRILEVNRGRDAFHRRLFKVDVNSPALYDLVVDSGRLSYPTTAAALARAAQLKEVMAAMTVRRYLVVVNQTLGSEPLLAKVRECLAAGPYQFHIVVPATSSR